MLLRVHFGSKAHYSHFCSFLTFFFHFSTEIYPNPILSLFTDKKNIIFHVLPEICKITTNFNLILSNVVTFGANHKFFTLTLNGLKAIAANQGNHVE